MQLEWARPWRLQKARCYLQAKDYKSCVCYICCSPPGPRARCISTRGPLSRSVPLSVQIQRSHPKCLHTDKDAEEEEAEEEEEEEEEDEACDSGQAAIHLGNLTWNLKTIVIQDILTLKSCSGHLQSCQLCADLFLGPWKSKSEQGRVFRMIRVKDPLLKGQSLVFGFPAGENFSAHKDLRLAEAAV